MIYDSEFGLYVFLYWDRIKQVIDDFLNEYFNLMILCVDLYDLIDIENMDNLFF